MIPGVIEGHTRVLGAPAGWTPETSGECGALAIRDGMSADQPCMLSLWELTAEDVATIVAGGKVMLSIIGRGHPPVWLEVVPA